MSVRTPAICIGSRARLCWNVRDADGSVQHGHHEAQQGVCVDLFIRFWSVCIYLQYTPVYAHVCLSAHLCVTPARKLKVKHSLMWVVSLPPFCQRGDTPLHLAARNDCLDAVQLLLQSFDTRDEVNMVDNQCKHPLYHGLVCGSVCSLANPLLDGGSTLDSLRCIKHVLVTIIQQSKLAWTPVLTGLLGASGHSSDWDWSLMMDIIWITMTVITYKMWKKAS